jgi:DNA-binding NarL/FixJ family response regulator
MLPNSTMAHGQVESVSNHGAWFTEDVAPEDVAPESAILRQAAANVDAGAPVAREVWADLSRGALRIVGSSARGDVLQVTAYTSDAGKSRTVTPAETEVLVRVLCGEQQKAVASDLSIAPSTASHRFAAGLRKMGVHRSAVPLPLVIAAQQASGLAARAAIQVVRFEQAGKAGLVLSVRRPDPRRLHSLTRAEQAVACLFIEGHSRQEIAQQRRASALTVAGQVHAIFSALRLSGRYSLIRRAGELGCF